MIFVIEKSFVFFVVHSKFLVIILTNFVFKELNNAIPFDIWGSHGGNDVFCP